MSMISTCATSGNCPADRLGSALMLWKYNQAHKPAQEHSEGYVDGNLFILHENASYSTEYG